MDNKNLPADKSQVLFKDLNGISHEGFYDQSLNAFVETAGDEGPEDAGNSYMENEVTEWEYVETNKNPDSDFMVIF